MDSQDPEHEIPVWTIFIVHVDTWQICVSEENEEWREENQHEVEGVPGQVDACIADKILHWLCDIWLRWVGPGTLELEL